MARNSVRWLAKRPTEIAPKLPDPLPAPPEVWSDFDRRARAFEHVWPLLSTSISTAEILRSYRDALARQP